MFGADLRRQVTHMCVAGGAKVKRSAARMRHFGGCRGATNRLYCRAMDEFGFHKMHSLGNDFVIIDRRSRQLPLSNAQIRLIADRRRGVGCDQLLALEPSERADLFMRVYNPDGSEAEACGNGTRCVARMIMEQHATSRVRIETRADVLVVSVGTQGYMVDMGRPRFGWDEIPLAEPMDTLALDLALGPLARPVALSMGNPHAIRRGLAERRADLLLDGGRLQIAWTEEGRVLMTGPASYGYSGRLHPELLAAAP
jgi:diaminopimelate epimerase